MGSPNHDADTNNLLRDTDLGSALPHIVLVITSMRVGGLIIAKAGLSYLGIGVESDKPTWGVQISEGQPLLLRAWWMSIIPGMAIFFVVAAFNFLGDWDARPVRPQAKADLTALTDSAPQLPYLRSR